MRRCHHFSHQDLTDVFGFYSNLDRQFEGFVEIRVALRDEYHTRDGQELLATTLSNIV